MNRIAWLAVVGFVAFTNFVHADDWPQWMGPNRDDVWHETGILEKFPDNGPKVLWRHPIAGGYAGPAVAGGKVYVADYFVDPPIDFKKVNNPMAGPKLNGKERLLCLDAKTGQELWKYESDVTYQVSYPAGPRCTPTVHDGKVYSLGAMGNLYCVDAEKGSLVWTKDFKTEYKAKVPVWGVCSHPLVDGDKVICIIGGETVTAVALDRNTGKEIWTALSAKHPGYSAPVIFEAGGKRQLVIFDGYNLSSLDPETGKLYWSFDDKPATQMSIMVPQKSGDYLYAAGRGMTDNGLMLKLASDKPEAKEAWRSSPKIGVAPINMTPFLDGETMYGVDQTGNLMAIKTATGERLWQTPAPVTGKKAEGSGTAFIVKNGDRFFLFNEKGELVIAKLTPAEYTEVGRAKILEPTNNAFGRDVVWSHPAFANKCVFARNDKEIVCVSLAAE
jgi:outer membrane protein assembly factor BamB